MRVLIGIQKPQVSPDYDYLKSRPPFTAFILGAAFGGVFGALAQTSSSAAFTLAMWLFSLAGCFVAGAGIYASLRIRAGSIRVPNTGPLVFFPQRVPRILLVLSLLAITAFGVVLCASWVLPGWEPIFQTRPGGANYRSGGFVAGVFTIGIGAGFLTYLVRRLLVPGPRGLEVSAVGLRWRESQRAEVTVILWDDLREVSVGVVTRARVVMISDAEGSIFVRGQSQLASDPVTVAEIIIYFRDHAEQRHLLNDPMRALAAVSDIRRVGLA